MCVSVKRSRRVKYLGTCKDAGITDQARCPARLAANMHAGKTGVGCTCLSTARYGGTWNLKISLRGCTATSYEASNHTLRYHNTFARNLGCEPQNFGGYSQSSSNYVVISLIRTLQFPLHVELETASQRRESQQITSLGGLPLGQDVLHVNAPRSDPPRCKFVPHTKTDRERRLVIEKQTTHLETE